MDEGDRSYKTYKTYKTNNRVDDSAEPTENEAFDGNGRNEFRPYKHAHTFEDEAFEGSGRNEFRPYNEGGNLC
jgi:hypothetical protein